MRSENHLPYQTHSSALFNTFKTIDLRCLCYFRTFPCSFRVPLNSPNPAHVPRTYMKTLHWKSFKNRAVGNEEWTLCALGEQLFWQHFKSERILVEEVLWVLRIEKREFFRFYSFSEEKLIFFSLLLVRDREKLKKAFNHNVNRTLNEINGSTTSKSISGSATYQENGSRLFNNKKQKNFLLRRFRLNFSKWNKQICSFTFQLRLRNFLWSHKVCREANARRWLLLPSNYVTSVEWRRTGTGYRGFGFMNKSFRDLSAFELSLGLNSLHQNFALHYTWDSTWKLIRNKKLVGFNFSSIWKYFRTRCLRENITNQEFKLKCEVFAFAADICLTFWGLALLLCSKLAFASPSPPANTPRNMYENSVKILFFACLSTTDIAWEGSLGAFLYSSVELKPFISFLIHTLFMIAISTIRSYFTWNLIWKQIRRQRGMCKIRSENLFSLISLLAALVHLSLRLPNVVFWTNTSQSRYLIQPAVLCKHFCAIAFCVNSIALRCRLSTEQ